MKVFERKTGWIIGIFITLFLVGGAVGSAVVAPAIWSNSTSVQVYLPISSGLTLATQGTVALNQAFTLYATLNPLPTVGQLQQNVTFFVSSVANANYLTPFTGNSATGLAYVNNSYLASTNETVSGVAQMNVTITTVGIYYFVAEIAAPM